MRDHGIVFVSEMAAALIAGKKTETRRVVAQQPEPLPSGEFVWRSGRAPSMRFKPAELRSFMLAGSPYKVGDGVWLRERCAYLDVEKSALSQFPLGPQNGNALGPDVWNVTVEYSDGSVRETSVEQEKPKQTRERGEIKWRSARFMHRWASRASFRIIEIRVERLHEITHDAAMREGCPENLANVSVAWYCGLWNSIHASTGQTWERNPWVYVLGLAR